jgi:hypothetical protein
MATGLALLSLPREIFEEIFLFVGGKDALRCRSLSKDYMRRIDEMSSFFWRKLYFVEFPAVSSFSDLPEFLDWLGEYRRKSAAVRMICSFCYEPMRLANSIRPFHRDSRAILCMKCVQGTGGREPCLLTVSKVVKEYKPLRASHLQNLYRTHFDSKCFSGMAEKRMKCGDYFFLWDILELQEQLRN